MSEVFETPRGNVTISAYKPGDEAGILELFNSVFGIGRPMEVWNWEYRDCPEGIHCFLGHLDDGQIVSQFCSIPSRVKIGSDEYLFGQIVDSMVHPNFRGSLKKKGLFASTVQAYVDHLGRADKELIMMGLPNPQAFRVGKKLCGYVPMTKIYVHTKAVEPDTTLPMPPIDVSFRMNEFRVQVVGRFSDDVRELWERVAPHHAVATVRSAKHLNWRFPDSPQWDYVLVEARGAEDNALHGYTVLRQKWLDQPDLMIADWFIDPEVPGVANALLANAEHLAAKAGMTAVKCLLNPMCEESRFFEDEGYDLTPTPFRMVSRTYDESIVTVPWLNRHWYYTMGDFDVV